MAYTRTGIPPELAKGMTVLRRDAEAVLVRAATETVGEVKRRAPFRTGELRRRVALGPVVWAGPVATVTFGVDVPYARYLEEGTGLYGPRHRWIVPVSARALRFPAGGRPSLFSAGQRVGGSAGPGFRLTGVQRSGAAGTSAQFVFAKRVRGVRPTHFFRDAILSSQGAVLRTMRAGLLEAARKVI